MTVIITNIVRDDLLVQKEGENLFKCTMRIASNYKRVYIISF